MMGNRLPPVTTTAREGQGHQESEGVGADANTKEDQESSLCSTAPPAHSRRGTSGMFAVLTGELTKLPFMYEMAVRTMMKVDPNFVLYTTQPLDEHQHQTTLNPRTVLLDMEQVIASLTDIHPPEVWQTMIQGLQQPGKASQMADFLRMYILYQHGGFYSDLDTWWLRPVPYDFMESVVVSHDGDGYVSVAAIGGPARDPIWRKSLENMPRHFESNANVWEVVGSGTVAPIVNAELNVDPQVWKHHIMKDGQYSDNIFQPLCLPLPQGRSLVSISDIQMFGVRYTEAPDLYSKPMTTKQQNEMYRTLTQHSLSHSLWGSRHAENRDRWPAKGSYFDRLLQELGYHNPHDTTQKAS